MDGWVRGGCLTSIHDRGLFVLQGRGRCWVLRLRVGCERVGRDAYGGAWVHLSIGSKQDPTVCLPVVAGAARRS